MLGVSEEQRQDELRQHIVSVGEQDPKYSGTQLGEKAKAHLKDRAKPLLIGHG